MLQSPLFVCTDFDSESKDEDFDSDDYDGDNDSINSDEISTAEPKTPINQRSDHCNIPWNEPDCKKETKEYFPPSTDPFAQNYRKKADWDEKRKERWQKEWAFVKDLVDKYESVEHAEFTRPFDQFRILLQVSSESRRFRGNAENIQNRGIYEKYEELWTTTSDSLQRSCDIMNMLLVEAPELIVRYSEIEKLTKERVAVMERGEKPSWEVAWEKRMKAELGPWGTPRII